MEGQKLVWIVFSVVLFVVVVLASVLYFLRPQAAQPALAGQPGAPQFDTYEYVRGSSPDLPVETPAAPEGTLDIVVGEEPTAAPAAAPVVTAPQPVALAPAPRVAVTAQPKPQPERRAVATRPAAPAPATPTRVFWIQTASFRSRTGAEAMAVSLGQKGITGRLQVSDVGGKPYYRVRVGPYTNRDEAEKFLSWIKGVKGLEQSYISVVSR